VLWTGCALGEPKRVELVFICFLFYNRLPETGKCLGEKFCSLASSMGICIQQGQYAAPCMAENWKRTQFPLVREKARESEENQTGFIPTHFCGN
jgi:hypothetical protein